MSEELKQIGKLIRDQDNRITDQPLFIVQRKRKDYGYDELWAEDCVWQNHEDDYHIACDRLHEILDRRDYMCRSTFGYEKVYYLERWEFVTACFTEQGCKDYLSSNGHNLGETRIYADGSYRNNEYRTVRNYLLSLTENNLKSAASG